MIVRHGFVTERPAFHHPSFDMEHRIVVADLGAFLMASVYVPNGGKDYDAKLSFFTALSAWAGETIAAGRDVVICGDLNIAREDRDVHPKERKLNQIGTRPEERAMLARMLDAGLLDVGRALDPDNNELFTWWRRGATSGSGTSAGGLTMCSPAAVWRRAPERGVAPGVRHERPRSGHCRVRRDVMSLRTRLILAFFLLSVVPMAAVTIYTTRRTSKRCASRRNTKRTCSPANWPAHDARDRAAVERVEHLMDIAELQTREADKATQQATRRRSRHRRPHTVVVRSRMWMRWRPLAKSLGETAMLLNNVRMTGGRVRRRPRRSWWSRPWRTAWIRAAPTAGGHGRSRDSDIANPSATPLASGSARGSRHPRGRGHPRRADHRGGGCVANSISGLSPTVSTAGRQHGEDARPAGARVTDAVADAVAAGTPTTQATTTISPVMMRAATS
jgi:hypothetical protein